MRADTAELQKAVLYGDMATISATTIREHHGKPWPGDRVVYETIEHAQHYLQGYDRSEQPVNHAIAIIAAAKVQVVAEAWGAVFAYDQAWSQAELQRLRDL